MNLFNNRFTSALMPKRKMGDDEMPDPENDYPEQQGVFANAMTGPDPLAPPKKQTLGDKLSDIYAKNKASQDALQQEASTPLDESLYKPSFGRKLGAALVGAAAGYGQPAIGYGIASRIASAPLDNAKEQRADRLADLGKASKVEQDKLGQALDITKANYQEEQDTESNRLRNNADIRAQKANDDAHVSGLLQDELVKKKLAETNNTLEAGNDGYMYLLNKDTGNVVSKIKIGQTPEEQTASKKELLQFGSTLDTARDAADAANRSNLQTQKDAAALERVKAKNTATLENIKAKAADKLKDPTFKAQFDKVIQAASQAAAATGLDVNDLIDATGAIPQVAGDGYFDTTEVARAKARLREMLAGGGTGDATGAKPDPAGIRPPR